MSHRISAAALIAGILLAGCSGSSSDSIGPTDPTSGNGDPGTGTGAGTFKALFAPGLGVFPYPVDFYFLGSTDGTLNLPSTLAPVMPNFAALNALDGYSTVASATARFSAPINEATLSGDTVKLVQVSVDNVTKAVGPPFVALTYGVDYEARVAQTFDSGGATLEVVPLHPLEPSTGATNVGYLIVLTNGILDTSGNPATPDVDYAAILGALGASPPCSTLPTASQGLCLLTGAQVQLAAAAFGPAIVPTIVLTFSYSTQATDDTMNYAAALAQPTPIVAVDTTFDLAMLGIPGAADIYAGILRIPYYHTPGAAAAQTSTWQGAPFTAVPGATPTTFLSRFNPVPVAQATLDIPLFVTVPNTVAKPAAGWPVVIFQHGLTGNRAQAAAIAGAYAQPGFVVASIDLPLHGITNDPADPFAALYADEAERTFNLDLVNNADGQSGPDGIDDPSGSYIINLASLLTSRDNLRQAAIDIVQLATSLPGLDLDGDTVPDVDPNRIHFSALSLGAITGTVANAMPIATVSAYLNAPGGGVANLLRESAALSGRINAGLAARNPLVVPGSTLYEQFFRDAQTVVDAGDPLNYIAQAVAARPVLLTQVLNDTVVPNSATQRLIDAAAFTQTANPGLNAVGANDGKWVHFNSGSHGSLLSPEASFDVTTEMQTQAGSLLFFGGSQFAISRPDLLEQP